MFSRVKGVSDNFFDLSFWDGVQKKIETHLKLYNFSKIEIPTLEHVSLFQRGLGFETDVVSKQMFIIESKNQSDEEQICLRPEATAGTMRAFVEQQAAISTPFKVYSYGPMFRYERPQKGRFREFHQLNIEAIGTNSIMHDVWLIKMLHTLFLEEFEMDNFVLKLNYLGQPSDRKEYVLSFKNFLENKKSQLCDVCVNRLQTNVLRILDCKSQNCQNAIVDAPKLFDFFSQETKAEWQQLCNGLEDLSVTFVNDQTLVRGLDYYNKTVFEFVSVQLGSQSAFCGGGRYDGLAQQLGSKNEVQSVGCAIGMERLLMILESKRNQFSESKLPLLCIVPLSLAQQTVALLLADNLLAHGKCVDVLLDGQTLKNCMKKANNMGAQFVLLLGEDEIKSNSVKIKNMITGEEKIILQVDAYKNV